MLRKLEKLQKKAGLTSKEVPQDHHTWGIWRRTLRWRRGDLPMAPLPFLDRAPVIPLPDMEECVTSDFFAGSRRRETPAQQRYRRRRVCEVAAW